MPARQLDDRVYAEDELLPLSGLQHYVFCERQCALIHLEQIWVDNVLTAEGTVLHGRADTPGVETRVDVMYSPRSAAAESTPWACRPCGCRGVSPARRPGRQWDPRDVAAGVELRDREGLWAPVPVEYKRGTPKFSNCDRVQLCAQALCLEEMLGVNLSRAELYYARPRRRTEVSSRCAAAPSDGGRSTRVPRTHRGQDDADCRIPAQVPELFAPSSHVVRHGAAGHSRLQPTHVAKYSGLWRSCRRAPTPEHAVRNDTGCLSGQGRSDSRRAC